MIYRLVTFLTIILLILVGYFLHRFYSEFVVYEKLLDNDKMCGKSPCMKCDSYNECN